MSHRRTSSAATRSKREHLEDNGEEGEAEIKNESQEKMSQEIEKTRSGGPREQPQIEKSAKNPIGGRRQASGLKLDAIASSSFPSPYLYSNFSAAAAAAPPPPPPPPSRSGTSASSDFPTANPLSCQNSSPLSPCAATSSNQFLSENQDQIQHLQKLVIDQFAEIGRLCKENQKLKVQNKYIKSRVSELEGHIKNIFQILDDLS